MSQFPEASLPEIDFTSEELWREPGRYCATLLEEDHCLARLPATGGLMALRYDDVTRALTDPRLGAMGTRAFEAIGWTEGPFVDWMRRNIVSVDPPMHTRLRRLVNRAFTPRRLEALAPAVRSLAWELADAMSDAREVDFYESFAQKLPLSVLGTLLNIPRVDHAQMAAWTTAINTASGIPNAEARRAADDAIEGLAAYADEIVTERRAHPRDDLLTALILAEEDGDSLDAQELTAMILQLLVAGHETTRNLIGNGLFSLLCHPEQLAALHANNELVENAVEETLRYEPSIIWIARTALEPTPFGDQTLQPGQMIVLNLAAANRDPRIHHDPQRFDIQRQTIRPISFGFGSHFCIGASLARMEARIAFDVLRTRFQALEFVGTPPRFAAYTALRTLESFRLRVTPR